MPGQQLQTLALILTRQPAAADAFEQLTAFAPEHGVLHCLRRIATAVPGKAARPSRATASPMDLFDEAELWLESSNQGRTWFIKEHQLVRRHDGIGRSYESLAAAASLGVLVARNPVPDDSREPVATLLRSSFAALATGGRPDIVRFKAIYCMLRDEGYPVRQQWWPQLSAPDRDLAAEVLNQPVAGQGADPAAVARIVRQLEHWVRGETEIRL